MNFPFGFTFLHSERRDGTIESVCLQCHAIVYKSFWEADLDQAEKLHACNPDLPAPWLHVGAESSIGFSKL